MRLLPVIVFGALFLRAEGQSAGLKPEDATSSNAATVSLTTIFDGYEKSKKFAAELKSEQEAAQKQLAELVDQQRNEEATEYKTKMSAQLKSEYIAHRNEVIADMNREITAYASSHQITIFDSDGGPVHDVPKIDPADAKARNLPDVSAEIIKEMNSNLRSPGTA